MTFSLGSQPLKGAVWVTPSVSSSDDVSNVVFTPPRVALYDNNTAAVVKVKIINPRKESFVIVNEIHSCDSAFRSGSANDGDNNVLLAVEPPEEKTSVWVIVGSSMAVLALLLVFVAYLLVQWKKRQNDNLWIVKHDQLKLGDPAEVAGRGTFGMVLVAEYRGTQVAVKKVLPATRDDSGTGSTMKVSGTFSGGAGLGSMSMLGSTLFAKGRTKQVQMKADFMSEMRQLAKLRHPCVTTIMGK